MILNIQYLWKPLISLIILSKTMNIINSRLRLFLFFSLSLSSSLNVSAQTEILLISSLSWEITNSSYWNTWQDHTGKHVIVLFSVFFAINNMVKALINTKISNSYYSTFSFSPLKRNPMLVDVMIFLVAFGFIRVLCCLI